MFALAQEQLELLPNLEAINATNVATNHPGHGCCRWQVVWGMSRREVELPLRAAIEYLAGRIEQAEFEHWASTDALQQLRQNLELGNRIVEVSIASRPDRDDDGLVIAFGDPD
jgi:hypothetical protein